MDWEEAQRQLGELRMQRVADLTVLGKARELESSMRRAAREQISPAESEAAAIATKADKIRRYFCMGELALPAEIDPALAAIAGSLANEPLTSDLIRRVEESLARYGAECRAAKDDTEQLQMEVDGLERMVRIAGSYLALLDSLVGRTRRCDEEINGKAEVV